MLTVDNSWMDPCHFEFYQVNVTSGQILLPDFNSGAFNVNTEKAATPTTWAANDINSACPTFYTSGTVVPTANSLQSGSAPTLTNGAASTDKCSSAQGNGISSSSDSPSFGAGIGVGIAISVAVIAGSALIWWCGHRQRSNNIPPRLAADQQMQSMHGYNGFAGGPSGLQGGIKAYEAPPAEMMADPRRLELPS
jgi:hypothetical protein